MPKIDLTGKEYEFFKVLKRNTERTGKNVWWDCECECGKPFVATTTEINKGTRRSCGCMRKQLIGQAHLQDLTGETFGELTVIKRDLTYPQNGSKPRTYWQCKCSCGNIVSIERTHLVNRGQASCGCKQSIGELNIHKILNDNHIFYQSQYTNLNLQTEKGGFLRFDFAILDDDDHVIRLIEFDGPQHTETFDYFGQHEEIAQRDEKKNLYAKQNSIPLVRIPYYKRDTLTLEDLMGDRFLI